MHAAPRLTALAILIAIGSMPAALQAKPSSEPLSIAALRGGALRPTATGFFVDDQGDIVTARHAVSGCGAIFIVKNRQMARAHLKAVSEDQDLAVIGSPFLPEMAASLARMPRVEQAQPIFAAGYEALQAMADRAGLLFNGFTRTAAGEGSNFTLVSAAETGASGSPVLDAGGSVVGLIAERISVSGGEPRSAGGNAVRESYVVAISAGNIERFLQANDIPFRASDAAALTPQQAHAPLAAAISVGIVCD